MPRLPWALSPAPRSCADNGGTKAEPAQGSNSFPPRHAAALSQHGCQPPQTRFTRPLFPWSPGRWRWTCILMMGGRQRPQPAPSGPFPALRIQPQFPHSSDQGRAGGPIPAGTSAGDHWGHHRGAARRRVSTKIKPALSESCRFGTGNSASSLSTRHQSPSDAEEPAPQTHPRRTRRQQSRRPRNEIGRAHV